MATTSSPSKNLDIFCIIFFSSGSDISLVLLVSGSLWFCLVPLSGSQIALEIEALYCTAPPLNWGHSAQNEQRITFAQNEQRIILSHLLEGIPLTKLSAQKCFCSRWHFQFGPIKLIQVLYSTEHTQKQNIFPLRKWDDIWSISPLQYFYRTQGMYCTSYLR